MQTKRPQAVAVLQIDNERVRVTEWRFADNAETGWHRHQFDYVVVPGKNGKLAIETPDGASSTVELTAHASYFRSAGVEHNVINASDGPFSFVEIELK
ncbi:MAG TPA: cupin domain-containing protein [Ramlibacter sp.]|nr:cupin domain-containing protein [Ramlibacter sp.]